MMQRYYFFCNHVSFSNGFWVSVLRPPPQGLSVAPKKLNKDTARQKFSEWYDKVAACTLREVKSVRDTIKFYEDEILNYFDGRKTNASAESLNSKIKCFRAQVKGVRDIPFFMYRLATVLG